MGARGRLWGPAWALGGAKRYVGPRCLAFGGGHGPNGPPPATAPGYGCCRCIIVRYVLIEVS